MLRRCDSHCGGGGSAPGAPTGASARLVLWPEAHDFGGGSAGQHQGMEQPRGGLSGGGGAEAHGFFARGRRRA